MHPGLEHEKASELNEEQITKKITAIQKRMGMAQTTGRTEAMFQLQALLDHYQEMLHEKLLIELQAILDDDPKLGRTVIDIDWPDPADEDDDPDKF